MGKFLLVGTALIALTLMSALKVHADQYVIVTRWSSIYSCPDNAPDHSLQQSLKAFESDSDDSARAYDMRTLCGSPLPIRLSGGAQRGRAFRLALYDCQSESLHFVPWPTYCSDYGESQYEDENYQGDPHPNLYDQRSHNDLGTLALILGAALLLNHGHDRHDRYDRHSYQSTAPGTWLHRRWR